MTNFPILERIIIRPENDLSGFYSNKDIPGKPQIIFYDIAVYDF